MAGTRAMRDFAGVGDATFAGASEHRFAAAAEAMKARAEELGASLSDVDPHVLTAYCASRAGSQASDEDLVAEVKRMSKEHLQETLQQVARAQAQEQEQEPAPALPAKPPAPAARRPAKRESTANPPRGSMRVAQQPAAALRGANGRVSFCCIAELRPPPGHTVHVVPEPVAPPDEGPKMGARPMVPPQATSVSSAMVAEAHWWRMAQPTPEPEPEVQRLLVPTMPPEPAPSSSDAIPEEPEAHSGVLVCEWVHSSTGRACIGRRFEQVITKRGALAIACAAWAARPPDSRRSGFWKGRRRVRARCPRLGLLSPMHCAHAARALSHPGSCRSRPSI